MPFTMNLTVDGVSIHGTTVEKGYASHGCIGVPNDFARKVFGITEVGTNGLFAVKFTIRHHTGGRFVESPMSILLFRPESTTLGIGGGLRR